MHCTATVRTHPLRQAASTVRYTCGDDEEVLAAGVCPAPLSEVAGRQERVHRHSVEQIVDFVPVVQILDGPCAADGGLYPCCAGTGDRSSSSRSSRRGAGGVLRDPTDAALEFEEEEGGRRRGGGGRAGDVRRVHRLARALQMAPLAPLPPFHGGTLRRRVGLHVRAR